MKPSILFILHLPPPVHGAAMVGQYIHDSQMINEAFDCHYINLTTARNLEDIGKPGIRKLGHFIGLLKAIWIHVRKIRPVLVYVTPNAKGGAFYKDFVVVQWLKLLGCKVVAHYHNKGVATKQHCWLDDKLYRIFFSRLRVILLADALYEDVHKYVERKDVFICPNGIPEITLDKKTHNEGNKLHLLFLSNLMIDKGVLVLLNALQQVSQQGYTFVCDIVGGETAEFNSGLFQKQITKRHLEKKVIYRGRKYGKEKEKYFQQADVFVFPTRNEAFPLVTLEAMQAELPIITTPVGGLVNQICDGQNGFLCPVDDVDSFSNAIITLLVDKKLRHSMGQAGRDKFEREYTLEVFERRFCEILRQLTIRGNKQQK